MTTLEIKNFYNEGRGKNAEGHSESVTFKDARVLSLGAFTNHIVTWIQLVHEYDHIVVHLKGKKGDLEVFRRMRIDSDVITETTKYERESSEIPAPEVIQNA